MKNRVTVSICGNDYTLVAEEQDAYMEKVAALVDAKMREIAASANVSVLHSAVLAAINIADDYYKLCDTADALRLELKKQSEENTALQAELSEAKRNLFKAKNKK